MSVAEWRRGGSRRGSCSLQMNCPGGGGRERTCVSKGVAMEVTWQHIWYEDWL